MREIGVFRIPARSLLVPGAPVLPLGKLGVEEGAPIALVPQLAGASSLGSLAPSSAFREEETPSSCLFPLSEKGPCSAFFNPRGSSSCLPGAVPGTGDAET